ncbi:MAG TPA: ATP-binding protein [Ktedonobacteraceae bacterium]|jgi:hypothetical protein
MSSDYTFHAHSWKAEYHEQVVAAYQGNPLIETLPRVYTREDVERLLKFDPGYVAEYQHFPPEVRRHLMLDAARFFQPLSLHFELQQRIDGMIRMGYVGRNPLDHGYWPETKWKIRSVREYKPDEIQQRVPCLGFTMVGMGGLGKSRTIERILNLYPQVIEHSNYKGQRFTWRQVVWLKIECPKGGGILGLCRNFFRELDRLLGTNYHQNFAVRGRPSIPSMVDSMENLCRVHSIGALVIDEIQNLRQAKGAEAAEMLSFFVQLDNQIGTPVVLIGTSKVLPILTGEFRRARRATGQGDMVWERMKEDARWRFFLETLWKYQYVDKPSSLADDLSHTLYDQSQGIPDIAIKLFFLAQMYAVVRKKPTITPTIIKAAARESLRLVKPFLDALRENKRLNGRFEDLAEIDLARELQKLLDDYEQSAPKGHTQKAEKDPGNKVQQPSDPESPSGTPPPPDEQQATPGSLDNSNKESEKPEVKGAILETVARGLSQKSGIYEALKTGGFICSLAQRYLGEA